MVRGTRPSRRGPRGRLRTPLWDATPPSPISSQGPSTSAVTSRHNHPHQDLSVLACLQPITAFSPIQDSGGRPRMPPASTSRAVINNSTVIEIIVRLLCQVRLDEPVKRERLFRSLCALIQQYNSKLYLPLYAFPEFEELQSSVLQQFEGLVEAAQTRLSAADNSHPILPQNPRTQLALRCCSPGPIDRYRMEFEELEELGHGGFGVVKKARNKLDGCFYAIKIVNVQDVCTSPALWLREVQALARLDHPNIVRYHSTWIQPYTHPLQSPFRAPATLREISSDTQDESSEDSSSEMCYIEKCTAPQDGHTSSDDSVVFMDTETGKDRTKSPSPDTQPSPPNRSHRPPKLSFNHATNTINSSSSASSDRANQALLPYRFWLQPQPRMCLFIQMGLCGESLGKWLDCRNSNSGPVEAQECLGIFREVVQAVEYIHGQDIIHRDIKPENIFFTLDRRKVQLGDFGLARPLPALPTTSTSHTCLTPIIDQPHTRDVGTPIYSAPELVGGNYGPKSDMHNLGIILLELFLPFKTQSERIKVITDLKIRRSINLDLTRRWPHVHPWVLSLTSPDPEQRPTSTTVLASPLLQYPAPPHPHPGDINSAPVTDSRDGSSGSPSMSPLEQNRPSQAETAVASGVIKPINIKTEELQVDHISIVQTSDTDSGDVKREFISKDEEIAKLKEENSELKKQIVLLQQENAYLRVSKHATQAAND